MFKLFTFFAIVALTCAASIPEKEDKEYDIIKILHSETVNKPDGSYTFEYQGEDGTIREENSVILDAGTEEQSTDVHGSYKYIDPDGKEVEVHYTAGRNGFVPYGTNIPAEITANAKAAAELPQQDYDEEKPIARKVKIVHKSQQLE